MWLAIVMGVPQIVQPVWDAPRALRALNDWDGTFVQAATPFLADLVAAVDAGERPPAALRIFVATGAAVPRGLAERATRILGTAVCGAWGTTESCLGSLSAPGDEPPKVWGTDGRALRGIGLRITDPQGRVASGGRGGPLRGPVADDVRGLRRPSRMDRRGIYARRLVPHRRSRRHGRVRIHSHHRARCAT